MTISIPIPANAELLIKGTKKIDFSTPLIKASGKEPKKVFLASLLGIPHGKIFEYLKKFVGDDLKVGELIAERQAVLIAKRYYSEYDGVLKEVNHSDGSIIIEVPTNDMSEITSCVKGEIEEITKKEIIVKVHQGKEFDLKETNASFGGETFFCTDIDCQLVDEEKINGKVILAEKLQPYEQVKLETLGASGFVTLESLPEIATVPHAKLSKIADFEKIENSHLPYCTIDTNASTIYLYS